MQQETEFILRRGDLTTEAVDAIVNAANGGLTGGGGVDGAIHRRGGPAILEACKKIVLAQGRLPAGQAVITEGGNLPARFVIHTVGPYWNGGVRDEEKTLASAYRTSLALADENGIRTIAFPAISTGSYLYPIEPATEIALSTCFAYVSGPTAITEIRFILFTEGDLQIYQNVFNRLKKNG